MNCSLAPIIWLVFTGLFSCMSWVEWKRSKCELQSLKKLIPNRKTGTMHMLGVNFSDLVDTLKNELNAANREAHRMAFGANLLAAPLRHWRASFYRSFVAELVNL